MLDKQHRYMYKSKDATHSQSWSLYENKDKEFNRLWTAVWNVISYENAAQIADRVMSTVSKVTTRHTGTNSECLEAIIANLQLPAHPLLHRAIINSKFLSNALIPSRSEVSSHYFHLLWMRVFIVIILMKKCWPRMSEDWSNYLKLMHDANLKLQPTDSSTVEVIVVYLYMALVFTAFSSTRRCGLVMEAESINSVIKVTRTKLPTQAMDFNQFLTIMFYGSSPTMPILEHNVSKVLQNDSISKTIPSYKKPDSSNNWRRLLIEKEGNEENVNHHTNGKLLKRQTPARPHERRTNPVIASPSPDVPLIEVATPQNELEDAELFSLLHPPTVEEVVEEDQMLLRRLNNNVDSAMTSQGDYLMETSDSMMWERQGEGTDTVTTPGLPRPYFNNRPLSGNMDRTPVKITSDEGYEFASYKIPTHERGSTIFASLRDEKNLFDEFKTMVGSVERLTEDVQKLIFSVGSPISPLTMKSAVAVDVPDSPTTIFAEDKSARNLSTST